MYSVYLGQKENGNAKSKKTLFSMVKIEYNHFIATKLYLL